MKELTWPAWFNGPKGESAIFESPDDVPNGWTSGAEKQTVKAAKAAKAATAKTETAPAAGSSPAKVEKADSAELDAYGHAYDPALHAATKSKTKAGLWRMKVGVARPEAAPGYPLDL